MKPLNIKPKNPITFIKPPNPINKSPFIDPREYEKQQEMFELPFKKAAEELSNKKYEEGRERQAAAKYGLNPDMSPFRNQGFGYPTTIANPNKLEPYSGGAIQNSYNRMGISGGETNAFKGLGGGFGKKLGDLEAASNRLAGAASQRRINEMREETKLKDTEIERQPARQRRSSIEMELNMLRANKPAFTGFQGPASNRPSEEKKAFISDLKSWEEKISNLESELSGLRLL